MVEPPAAPEPDSKDWTWTLERRCEECGLAAGEIPFSEIADRALKAGEEWVQILRSHPAAAARPERQVWSPLEYGAHVADVYAVFEERLARMLDEDDPVFANWDQDQAALDGRYAEQDPEDVADRIEDVAQRFAARIDSLTPQQLDRPGRRSNGSQFTVLTLLQYFLHDIAHHLWDVTGQQDGAASLSWV